MHMLTPNFKKNYKKKKTNEKTKQQPHNNLVYKIHEPKANTIKLLVGTMQRG